MHSSAGFPHVVFIAFASVHVQVVNAKKAQAAAAEQLRRLQVEAEAEREAAKARESQLQAKLHRIQEVRGPYKLI